MKSPKERQRAYRERRKEHKNAGLTKLKILTSATAGKKLEMLSEIDKTDIGKVLDQAVEQLWIQRFGATEASAERVAEPKAEKPLKPGKEKASKPEKDNTSNSDKQKVAKTQKKKAAKAEKERTVKPEKIKTKAAKVKANVEPENPIIAGIL